MKPETRFRTNKVLPFLKTLKHCARFPIQQVAIHGDPDYLLCIWGRFVGLELKAEKKNPTVLQLEKLADIERTEGATIVAYPENWEQVKLRLSYMDAAKENAWKKLAPLR